MSVVDLLVFVPILVLFVFLTFLPLFSKEE